MEELFLTVSQRRGGYLLRRDLIEMGLDDRHIRHAVRIGLLERLRHGTYAPTSITRPLTPEEKHRLLAFATLDRLGPGVVLSHVTAAVIHTGQSYGADLSRVHVTRRIGRHARDVAGVVHHVGRLTDADVVEVDGRPVVTPARAVIESASVTNLESGMVTASFALRVGACTAEELQERLARHARWPGMLRVRLAVAYAEPACETVGEVRSFYMFRRGGLPRPEPQVEIHDANGQLIARVDAEWLDYRHVWEFDGMVKYGALNAGALRPEEVLVREKLREDRIRATERGATRGTWEDLARPVVTVARIRHDLERSRRLYVVNRAG